MARSIIFLHSASFVHKNIRPETVLTTDCGASYLVGFQRFRTAAGRTYMTGDEIWHENLYRHPTRQGEAPEEVYNMRHDVYSLGVCLLEIGLWTSFVTYDVQSTQFGATLPSMREIADLLRVRDERKRAFDIKRLLTKLATERLPGRMGDLYTQVVVSCLACLDKDGSFASTADSEDGDGIAIGVHYISTVSPHCALPNRTVTDFQYRSSRRSKR
jgi:serine/threonine protein kinase